MPEIIWWIIAVIIIAALIILLSPVVISASTVRSGGRTDGNISIAWLVFLMRYALRDRRTEIFAFNRKVISRQYRKKREGAKKAGKRGVPPVGLIFNLAGPLLRLFKDVIAAFRLRYFDIDVTYGLSDPAYTGMLTGVLHTVSGTLQTGHNIRFVPDFTGTVMEFNVKASASIVPARLIPPVVRFAASRQVLSSGWRVIRR